MKFFQENYIKNLPDCYDKEKTSNFDKIMQLLRHDEEKFRAVLQELHDCLDLELATGYSLNMYGDMVGRSRGSATDEQYRALIMVSIAKQRSTVDNRGIINSLSASLNIPSEMFTLTDSETSGYVDIELPIAPLITSGLLPDQVYNELKTLLAAGVGIHSINIEHDESEVELVVGNAITLGENFIADIEADVFEKVNAASQMATALIFAENFCLEVA